MLLGSRRSFKPSKHFAAVMLRVKPTQDQVKTMNKNLFKFNKALRTRLSDLQRGYFRDLAVPFDSTKYSCPKLNHELPYDALIRGYGDAEIEGRLIHPGILNVDSLRSSTAASLWPTDFTSLGPLVDEFAIDTLHCSLTPVIRFDNDESALIYKKNFFNLVDELKSKGLLSSKSLTIKLANRFTVLSKIDYLKFFAAVNLNRSTAAKFEKIYEPISNLRFQNKGEPNFDAGIVLGESKTDPITKFGNLHVTLGVSNLNFNQIDNLNIYFGMNELFYLNEVLLRPKNELLEKYGEDVPTLQFISNVDSVIPISSLEQLQLKCDALILSYNGSQLVVNLD